MYKHENLLPFGLTPGPKAPKDLDSFITPFPEELHLLQTGVKAYDSLTKSEFTLKGHLVLTGDTPAISKLLHLSGHNTIYPGRACNLREHVPLRLKSCIFPPSHTRIPPTGSSVSSLCSHSSASSFIGFCPLRVCIKELQTRDNRKVGICCFGL